MLPGSHAACPCLPGSLSVPTGPTLLKWHGTMACRTTGTLTRASRSAKASIASALPRKVRWWPGVLAEQRQRRDRGGETKTANRRWFRGGRALDVAHFFAHFCAPPRPSSSRQFCSGWENHPDQGWIPRDSPPELSCVSELPHCIASLLRSCPAALWTSPSDLPPSLHPPRHFRSATAWST